MPAPISSPPRRLSQRHRRFEHGRIEVCTATQHTFPLTIETPASTETRAEHTPTAVAFNGQCVAVAQRTAIAVRNHHDVEAREKPDDDHAHCDKESDKDPRVGPRPASRYYALDIHGLCLGPTSAVRPATTARRMRRRFPRDRALLRHSHQRCGLRFRARVA